MPANRSIPSQTTCLWTFWRLRRWLFNNMLFWRLQLSLNLKIDYDNNIGRLLPYGMKPNPSKFHLVIISNERTQKQYIDIVDGIILRSEPRVKLLRVTSDDRLQCNWYVKKCCSRATIPSNTLSRISRHIGFKIEIHNIWQLHRITSTIAFRYSTFVERQIVTSSNNCQSDHLELCVMISSVPFRDW